MKITVIGAGNIGGATAMGLAGSSLTRPVDICVTARHEEKLQRFAAAGLTTSTDNRKAVSGADIICIAVKPWQVEEMLAGIKDAIPSNALVVSIAPGVAADKLQSWLPEGQKLCYAIPNTAAEIGESMTYISPVNAGESDLRTLEGLFSAAGKVQIVPPELMLCGTSLASCGIAYAMRFIGAAAKAAEGLGIGREEALEAACQTVLGAARLIMAHGADPEVEIKKVTTPGGLTERGLKAMEDRGFSEAVAAAIGAIKK